MNWSLQALIEEEKRERDRTIVAIALSVLLHVVLLLTAIALIALAPEPPPPPEPAPASDAPVEVSVLEPPKQEERAFVDSADLLTADQPPEETAPESDRDTVAASTTLGTGPDDLPNQEGEEQQMLAVVDKDFSLGDTPAQPGAAPQPPTPPQPESEPQEPKEPQEPTENQDEQPPDPEAESTPREIPPNSVNLLEPEIRKPQRAEVARAETAPNQPGQPGYQPETRVTRIKGGIDNRDRRSSIAARATPLGKYKKMVSDAIGSRWYYYVNQTLDLVSIGSVEIRFIVKRNGEIEKIRVLSNTSNESLASASVGSIMDARIPPIPDEVAQTLDGERLEIDFTFSILR